MIYLFLKDKILLIIIGDVVKIQQLKNMFKSKDNNDQSKIIEMLVKSLVNGIDNSNSDDDQKFRTKAKEQIQDRDAEYTNLLKHFVFVTKVRNVLKEFFKWSFYVAMIISIIYLAHTISNLFSAFIMRAEVEQLIEAIPLFVTAIVGFVSVVVAIPITITKYLFSTKEDKHITDIILHTQEHDTSGRQWTLDFNKISKGLSEGGSSSSNGQTEPNFPITTESNISATP